MNTQTNSYHNVVQLDWFSKDRDSYLVLDYGKYWLFPKHHYEITNKKYEITNKKYEITNKSKNLPIKKHVQNEIINL